MKRKTPLSGFVLFRFVHHVKFEAWSPFREDCHIWNWEKTEEMDQENEILLMLFLVFFYKL